MERWEEEEEWRGVYKHAQSISYVRHPGCLEQPQDAPSEGGCMDPGISTRARSKGILGLGYGIF